MANNDILKLIISAFNLNDRSVIEILSLAQFNGTPEQVSAWLKKENDETFSKLNDTELALFLNGLINFKRGKRDGEQAKPEDYLNNNMVFQKLRIALNLKTEDILNVFQGVDVQFSKHEVTAFFRKPDNKHYRECSDKTLQKFLQGVRG